MLSFKNKYLTNLQYASYVSFSVPALVFLYNLLLSRFLSIEDFGIYNSMVIIVLTAIGIANFGMTSTLNLLIHRFNNQKIIYDSIRLVLTIKLSISLLFTTGIALWLATTAPHRIDVFIIIAATQLLFMISDFGGQLFLIMHETKKYASALFVRNIVMTILLSALVIITGTIDFLLAMILAFATAIITVLFVYTHLARILKRLIHNTTNSFKKHAKWFFQNSFYNYINEFTQGWFERIDIIMLTILSSAFFVGSYATSLLFGNIFFALMVPLLTILSPMVADLYYNNKDVLKHNLTIMYNSVIIIYFPMISLALILFPHIIEGIYGDKYMHIIATCFVIAFTMGIKIISAMHYSVLVATENAKHMAPIVIISLVIAITLNVILIPLYGIIGAATATLLSYFFHAIMGLILISKKLAIKPIQIKTILLAMTFSITMLTIANITGTTLLQSITLCIVGCIVYLIMIIATKNHFYDAILLIAHNRK